MSKIFKASKISVDEFNKVLIKTDKVVQKPAQKSSENQNDEVVAKIDTESLLLDAQKKADAIIEKAEREKEKIIDLANEEKEEIFRTAKKEGYDLGYKEGYDEGVEAGKGTYNDLNTEAAQHIKEYTSKKETLLEDAEAEVVDLIIDILENLTLSMFDLKEDLVQVLVRRGLQNATVQNKVSIKVSNEDYDYVMENKEELRKYLDSSKEIEILKDFSLMKNDCMLETEFGNINCGLGQQLNSIKESIYCIFKDR